MNDSLFPTTSAEWFDWLSAEEEKTRKSYLAKPATLVGNYRNEMATTHDYEGREILELLQNAADQAKEADVPGRVVIELLPEGLVIANSGAAFSIGGVLSLENAYLSPKRHKRRQFIGNKGLGFRSVLNWTRAPLILSGSLRLAYNQDVSQQKLNELLEGSPELAGLVQEEAGESDALVIPVLPFPGYRKDGNIGALINDTPTQQLLKCCEKWRESGYSTAIGMPFEEATSFDTARRQIQALRPEILLFVDHLDEVRFIIDGEENRLWKLDGDDTAAMVMDNHDPLGIWQIHRTQGIIPDDKLDKDQRRPLNYELIIAVPEMVSLQELKVSPLFSYFPTTITLPLPVVCHATLELDQSRNHVQPCRSNGYVFEQLACFLADVAEQRAAKCNVGAKAGFRILMPLETYPSDLKRDEFPERLIEAATRREIVPTLCGRSVLAEQALYLNGASDSWLPKSSFEEVVPIWVSQERDFFESIGVKNMDTVTLRKRFLTIGDLTIRQRAAFITGILKHNISADTHSSALLRSPSNQSIPDQAVVFISPKGVIVPRLPDWVALWFLDDGLRSELMARLDVNDVRELQGKLSSFGLLEYSFARLISRLVAAANHRKKEQPDMSSSIERDLLLLVFALYRSEGKSGSHPAFPDKTSLLLPSQVGRNFPAETLYVGRGYGANGNIVQALYEGWAPEKLLVEPHFLGLTGTVIEILNFLKWLGVAVWPRNKETNKPEPQYLHHVLDRIPYPARFTGNRDYIFNLRSDVKGSKINSAMTLDGLNEILEKADSVAITAWLAFDGRAAEWTRMNVNHASLTALTGGDWQPREYQGPIPSYIRWKLETTEWLIDKEQSRLRPKDCVLGQRAIEVLFPRPANAGRNELVHYGISENDVIEGWRRSGVLTSLAELDLGDLYSRLLELPEKQPEGRSARSLYRWLMDAADAALGEGGNALKRFFAEGQMWGRWGDKTGYFPVSELFHSDSEGLPTTLLHRLKIVDLPYRVGADKVKRIFGVEPIDRTAIKQQMKSHRLAKDLDSEFQIAKPFLYKLRASQSSHTQYLSTLKSLALKVCSDLCATMEYDGEEIDFELPIWGWLIDKDVLYIRSDPTEIVSSQSALLADSIGAAIASIFRIGDGGDFARMFLCRQKDRKVLLRCILGEDADEDMDWIISEFGQPGSGGSSALSELVGPIEDLEVADSDSSHVDTVLHKDNLEEIQASPNGMNVNQLNPEDLSIKPVVHQPKQAPTQQKIRVQRKSSKHSVHTSTTRVTDPDFVERKVMEIEASFLPSRYPLRVGQLMGTEAPGCDILSFSSEEKRDKFKSGEDRDLANVLRFIEVKGRKNEGSEIELRGNEKDAAVKFSHRYYLYRLFKSGDCEYVLSILKDPLASDGALEAAVYVHIDRAKDMEQYEISGGIMLSHQAGEG